MRTTLRVSPTFRLCRPLLLMLGLVLCLGTGRLFAQSDLGSIRGTVQDESGAAIPGASIEITDRKSVV